MDTVAQKATELGVSDFWPLLTERTNVRISAERAEGRRTHWQKIAVHAAEQSGRLFVPTVHAPLSLMDYLDGVEPPLRVILQPGAAPLPTRLSVRPLALLVGPEGGWTDRELDVAREAGAMPCGLGDWILRAETAPLAALAAIRQLWAWT